MRSSRLKLEAIADLENLREAFLEAARGKASRSVVIAFREDLNRQLVHLRQELLEECVSVGNFTSFTIFEPKERRIHAPVFRERVLHHALMRPCERDFERWLMDDVYACRKGKGREAALRRAEALMVRNGWFMKLDIRKYFDSIPHEVLIREISRRFRDKRVAGLWRQIIQAYSTTAGGGLPIGALTSQHLANFYLGSLDRFIKEHLRIKGYLRYMDDMVLFDDKDPLKAALPRIRAFLGKSLQLQLHPAQPIQPVQRGAAFLGYRVFPGSSQLLRASRRRFLRRWNWIEGSRGNGTLGDQNAQNRVLAMISFVRVARREKLLNFLYGK